MKTPILTCANLLFFFGSLASAGVIVTPTGVSVAGVIEGDALTLPPLDGDTVDYLTFEVTTPGPVRLIATNIGNSFFLAMGQIIPGERFDIVEPPYLIFPTRMTPLEFTHILDPGIYVVQVAEEEYREGDLGPWFEPVHRSGGGFVAAPYSFAVEGQFQALDFMEGNLNGTFTVTHVPEPSAAALLCIATAWLTTRRRRRIGVGLFG